MRLLKGGFYPMKQLLFVCIIGVFMILTGCETEGVTVPDFYGMDKGDALTWGFENGIDVSFSSEYNNDVDKNIITGQNIEAGETVPLDGAIIVTYSRGKDPDDAIVIPDFTTNSEDDIRSWLYDEDILKFKFKDQYSETIPEGQYIGYDVYNYGEEDINLRGDSYTFYFSRGPIEIEEVNFYKSGTIRGVNLGGWFVLEGWMTPDLFYGVSGSDESIFMEEKEDALTVLEEHWDTFITEEDFQFLSNHGINYVRIPIPWWYQGDTFTYTHEGITHTITYGDSTAYIERAMEWAETYNIKVLLDLHTAPGGQNGFDNGGLTGVVQWEREENVALTLEKIEDIVIHFSAYDSLWGIEVLNEPNWGIDMGILQQFYADSYDVIRQHNQDVWIGFHDGFRGYMESAWKPFFNYYDFDKVFFDIHLYQTFGDSWSSFDIFDHLEWVEVEQAKAVQRYGSIVPVIVGEWSLGLQGNVYQGLDQESIEKLKIAYGNKQLNVFEEGMGWFFWNYKIDQSSHLEWDMQRLILQGIFPDNFETDEEVE